jgi:hypothetical protein
MVELHYNRIANLSWNRHLCAEYAPNNKKNRKQKRYVWTSSKGSVKIPRRKVAEVRVYWYGRTTKALLV